MSHESSNAMALARLKGAKKEEVQQASKPLLGDEPKRSFWNSVFCCFGHNARQAERPKDSEQQSVGNGKKVAYSDLAPLRHV